MWALGLLFLSIVVGWQVVRLLPLKMHRLEALAASVAVGFNISGWAFLVMAAAFGFSIGLSVAIGLLLAAVSIGWWRLKSRATLTSTQYTKNPFYRWVSRVLALLIVVWVSNLVVLSYQFPSATGAWLSNGNVWGDSPLHVGLITQFAHGNTLDLVSPIYQKVILTYPFIADFWSGILMRMGGDWYISLMLPSLIMMLSLLQLVFSFGLRLLGSVRAAWLQFLMLVFSGSLRGGWMLSKILFTKGLVAYNAVVGTSLAFATGDNYLNFLHSHALPQRSYLFGMPLLIVVASVALQLYREKPAKTSHRVALSTGIIAGALAGLLPLVHTHSFLLLAAVLALATGLFWWRHTKLPAGWLPMLVTMAVVAAPQIIWQFATTYDSHFNHWIWGWMMQNFSPQPHANWLVYWFVNIGFLFIFILAGWYWLRRARATPEIWLCYVAGVLVFAACNVYVFQPSLWDNMKFFEYAFWLEMLAIAYVFDRWWRHIGGKIVTSVLMISLCAMGFYTIVLSGPVLTFELLSANEARFGEHMQTLLPPDAYILVGDRHNHPITMLADRKVLMSYAGWYNLYHANWPVVLADRTTMLTGGSGAAQLIRSYGLTHAVFSDSEVALSNANLDFYRSHYQLLTNESGWWVFDLRRPK